MRDLNTYFKKCIAEIKATGIQYGEISDIRVGSQNMKFIGLCHHLRDGTHMIEINPVILTSSTPIKSLKEVIIHEILHTCKGCDNHGRIWKQLAAKINARYGYNVTHYSSYVTLGITAEKLAQSAKYVIECTNCGELYSYKRRSKVIDSYKKCSCGNCKRKALRLRTDLIKS